MELVDIGPESERAFFTCLHADAAGAWEASRAARQWYAAHREKGYRAQVVRLGDGRIVGKCHSIPVEHSPFVGRELLAILCLCVYPYEDFVGDQRRNGYGRFMLDPIERAAQSSGFKGVAAWGMDWHWNPVSFYEHLGYARVDAEDKVVAVWKAFGAGAEAPRLLRLEETGGRSGGKVRVVVADNPWCDGNRKRAVAREAVQAIETMVDYEEVGPPWRDRMIHLGHVGGVFLDERAYRPYALIGSSDELRGEIVRLYRDRGGE